MGAKDMGTLYGGQSGVQGESLPGCEGNVIDQDIERRGSWSP